jgi:indole-3-glycerol phosphate synthase
MTILDEIFAYKRQELAARQAAQPLVEVRAAAYAAAPARAFLAALRPGGHPPGSPALIAEVKGRSPSRGVLAADFDPLALAGLYAANGAAAISVLTDQRFFGGSLEHLRGIRQRLGAACPPLLRKDFLCDPYQVYGARAAGADAVLLIAAYLPAAVLGELQALAQALGMAALVEVHTVDELALALACRPALVGINNRNLHDFTVDLNNTLRLRSLVPPGIVVVTESGIHTPDDVIRLAAAGVDAMLVGESLVTAPDIAARVREFAAAAPAGPR